MNLQERKKNIPLRGKKSNIRRLQKKGQKTNGKNGK